MEYDQSQRRRGKRNRKTEAALHIYKYTWQLCWRLGWTSEELKMQDMENGFY